MSTSWICVKCGTTMISKCPHQRSTFFGPDQSYIRSVLMTEVLHVGPSRSEVFINITDYESSGDPVLRAIEFLADNVDKLKSITCEHYFILNSNTETECSLGCTHNNLNDLATIKEDLQIIDYSDPVSFDQVLERYSEYVHTVLMRMKLDARSTFKELPSTHPDYAEEKNWYFCFQDDIDALSSQVGKAVNRIKAKQSVRKTYRLSFGYKADIPDVYSEDLEQIIRLARSYEADGFECRVLERVRDTTHYREVEVAYEKGHQHYCDICDENAGRGKIILLEDGRVRHQSCQRKVDNRYKVATRMVTIPITREEFERYERKHDGWYEAEQHLIYDMIHTEVEVLGGGFNLAGSKLRLRVRAQNNTIDSIKDFIAGK